MTAPGALATAGETSDAETEAVPGQRQGVTFASLAPGQALAGEDVELPAWTRAVTGRLALQRSRPAARGTGCGTAVIDLRRTLRRWARWGRPSIAPVRRPRLRRPGKLSVLWDVSASMTECMDLYLPWLWTMVRRQPDTRVYAFGTRVVDVTPWLARPYAECRARMGLEERVWRSGTDIGTSLRTWLEGDGAERLGASACVVIISDGWDAGPPEVLRDAMRTLRSRAATVLWLHPWFGTPGFAPETRALRTALPYVDALLDGSTPEALCALEAPRAAYRFTAGGDK